jgi:GMP synthase-like glutamine amidotransferase
MPSTAQRGLVLQHGELGPPGVLGEWLDARGIPFDVHRTWEEGADLDPRGLRFVASLGSPYSPVDTAPAWVPDELGTLRRAVDHDVPVLGLCFGGQALSVVLGGKMRLADPPEVAWMPVETADASWIPPGPWLNFHWEVFTLPPGADELARTPAGVAAFRHGRHLGTQFHPEATPAIVEGWTRAEPRLDALGVDAAALLADGRRTEAAARRSAFELFDRWAGTAL